MIKINKTDITITRGDSAYIEFFLIDNMGQEVILDYGDVIRCQVREDCDGELIFNGDIERSTTSNQIIWHIHPDDTSGLDVGTYYWDAQVEYTNGDIFTFVDVSKFNVVKEITLTRE